MPSSLSTLSEWTHAFTHGIFETPASEWLAFFDRKVAPDAQFTINGNTLTAEEVKAYWAKSRDKFVSQSINWQKTAESPKDPANPTKVGVARCHGKSSLGADIYPRQESLRDSTSTLGSTRTQRTWRCRHS
jgi:hypothetical protein